MGIRILNRSVFLRFACVLAPDSLAQTPLFYSFGSSGGKNTWRFFNGLKFFSKKRLQETHGTADS
jgi:hypothetical protein